MADTPRVTVPVEPHAHIVWNADRSEAVIFVDQDGEPSAWPLTAADDAHQASTGRSRKPGLGSALAEAFYEVYDDDDERPIQSVPLSALSAAPAPEGGATGAKAVIRNGKIVISVDVDALPLILSGSIALNAVAGTFKVTDAATFAKEVCYALNAEKEDGTTRVHMMFDSAFNHAIDQGAEGVDEINEDEFEAEAARLQAEAQAALATREEAPAWTARTEAAWAENNREEAPAEAEEPAVIKGDGFNPQGGGLAILFVDGVRYTADQVRAALRAQPEAREDAQPVAWLETNRANGEQRATVRQPSDTPTMGKRWTYTPLYTHPAPDALRVAVEALEPFAAHPDFHAGDDWPVTFVNDEERAPGVTAGDFRRARKALTALQAEQGAK